MAEIKYVNVLDAISQFRNYHTSVILTYGANLAFYEQGVLNRIWQADCKNNLIFMDAGLYFETISEFRDTLGHIGRRYLVVPIDVGAFQAFHPKIILLLGSDRACLLLGSGNLTFNGYGNNLELFTQVEWSNDAKSYQRIFSEIWHIIVTTQKRWGHFEQANSMLRKAELQSEWLLEDSPATDLQVISSLDLPLLDQLTECVGDQKIERITILSPFLDNKSKAIGKLNQRFSPKKIDLLLQNGKTSGDIKSLNKLRPSGVPIKFYSFEEDDRYLHAKLYAIEGKKGSILAIGSANCTEAGLLASSTNANMETLIIHKYKTQERLQKILSKYKSSQHINLTDSMVLLPKPLLNKRQRLPINFQEIVLDGQTIAVKFLVHSFLSKMNHLVLRFSLLTKLTFPIEEYNNGVNSVKLSITDSAAQLLNNSICAASICGMDTKTQKIIPISNSLWLTNVGELNRRQIFLTPNDERAAQLLNEMHLGADEDWRDLYNTILTLVEFRLEGLKSLRHETHTDKRKTKNIGPESTERENVLQVIDSTEQDVFGFGNKEVETLRDSTLNSWLAIVFSQFPRKNKPNSDDVEKPIPPKKHHHKPNPGLASRFIHLVKRYINSLNDPEIMQSTSPLYTIAYFSIFQKLVWLLHKHEAINEGKLVKYICQIHTGFFGSVEDSTVPFGTQELRNHLSCRYYQQWNDSSTHLYGLASLVAIRKLSVNFDGLFIQALANICSLIKPSDLFEDQTGLLQVATSYSTSQQALVRKLSKNIERLLPKALEKLEKWNTTTTLMLKGLENDEMRIQRTALVSIGIAAERIAEHIGNRKQQIYYCTEVIFRTSQLNYLTLNSDYQQKLVELLKLKGDLPSLARALFDQGKAHNSAQEYKQAVQSFLQAQAIARELKNNSLLRVIGIYISGAEFLSEKKNGDIRG